MLNKNTLTPKLLDSKQASNYLGCGPNSLKVSRSSGILYGVRAPAYLKIGNKSIRYKISTLDEWLEQFTEQNNTAQNTR